MLAQLIAHSLNLALIIVNRLFFLSIKHIALCSYWFAWGKIIYYIANIQLVRKVVTLFGHMLTALAMGQCTVCLPAQWLWQTCSKYTCTLLKWETIGNNEVFLLNVGDYKTSSSIWALSTTFNTTAI